MTESEYNSEVFGWDGIIEPDQVGRVHQEFEGNDYISTDEDWSDIHE